MFDNFIDRMKKCSEKKVFVTVSGNPEVPTYEYQTVDGIKMLVKNGVTNIQDLIDSFAMSQDIHVMIAKFLNGDTSVISNAVGSFGDFRNMPNTYAELFDRVQACNNIFDSMPADIRNKFDNSSEKFWSNYGNKYFNDVFSEFMPKDESPEMYEPKNDVKENKDA